MMAPEESRLWHSQASMSAVEGHELVIVRGRGSYVWDEDGNQLLDATASLWYCNIGHGRAEIADAVDAQMRELETYHTFGAFANEPALAIADRLAEMVPIDDPRIFLTSGGGDSVEVAAKLSRRYWDEIGRPEKRLIITRELSYHGLHGFGTGIGGLDFNRTGQGELVSDTARVATNDASALEALVAERGADTIAAFFCEPVVGAGGVIPPADGYLEEVRRICRENEILFVVDEVITGFGRAGAMFASDRFDLQPDMMLMAKGVTSGYLPLGAVAITRPVWEPFWDPERAAMFHHGITYSGHASACAAAMVNLDILENEKLSERALELEGTLIEALSPLESHPQVSEVRGGVGLLAAVELEDATQAPEVAKRCLGSGVILRPIANGGLQISPPLVITESEIARIAEVISEQLG